MTGTDRLSLDWCLAYAARMLAGCLARVFPTGQASHVLRGAWTGACRDLRFLEALTRRLLVALADALELEDIRPAAPVMETRHRPPTPRGPAMLSFCLTDPLPGLAQLQALHGAATSTGAVRPAPGEPALPVVPARRLAGRLAALSRVLEAPEAAARRMARWLARRQTGRLVPIRPGPPPAGIRRGGLSLDASIWGEAERLCLGALNRPPGTP